MAFYDVNAAIDKPNFLNSFRQGQQYGQQLREQAQQAEDQNALRSLAPQVIQGDPAAYDQAAAISPERARAMQGAGDEQIRRMKGAIEFIDAAAKTNNPQQVEAAYQQVRPFLARFGQEPPATFAEAAPKFQEAKARIAMLDASGGQGRVQSTYVDGNGQRVAIMADGSQKVLGANDAGMSQQTISIPGADGRPRQFTFDKRTGNYVPAGGQVSALGNPQFTGPDGQPIAIDPQLPVALQEQIRANPTAFQAVPDGSSVQFDASQQSPPPAPAGPSPFVGRSPEEQAALTTAAQEQAKLAVLPQQLQLETEAAVQTAAQKAEAEARVKREADLATAAQKKYVDASTTLGLLDEAEKLLGASTGSLVGSARDAIYGAVGSSTPGAQAIAQLQPIAASLTLAVPRMEGPQSDADRLLYQKAAGDFANPNVPSETRQAALVQMRRLAQRYQANGGRTPAVPSGEPVRVTGAGDYNALPSGALFIAPDGTTRRKR